MKTKQRAKMILAWVCGMLTASSALAQFAWNTTSGQWHEGVNWTPEGPPTEGSSVVVGADANILLSEPTAALASFTMTGGTLTFTNWNTKIIAGNIRIEGGEVTHVTNFVTAAVEGQWIPYARVYFECDTFYLDGVAGINVRGKGYPGRTGSWVGGYGPGGSPGSTRGAGHGGRGGSTGNSGGAGRIAVWRGRHYYQGHVNTDPGDPVAHYAGVDQPTGSVPFWGDLPPVGTIFVFQ